MFQVNGAASYIRHGRRGDAFSHVYVGVRGSRDAQQIDAIIHQHVASPS